MIQAHHQSAAGPVRFTAVSVSLREVPREWERCLGYEYPTGCPGAAAAPQRFALLAPPGGSGRLLLLTSPVATGRAGSSFTHLLVVPPGRWPLLDLLRGRFDPFWLRSAEPDIVLPDLPDDRLPWRTPADLDPRFRAWLRGHPDNEALLRAVLVDHLTVPGDGVITLAAAAEDVFWLVYGIARLLPRAATDSLTFSTFENAPLRQEAARVVGAGAGSAADLPENCRLAPNVARDRGTTAGAPAGADLTAASRYAANAVRSWQEPEASAVFERFRADAAAKSDPKELDAWLRVVADVNRVPVQELLDLSRQEEWLVRLARTPNFFRRVADAASDDLTRRLIAISGSEDNAKHARLITDKVRSAIQTGDARNAERWLNRLAFLPDPHRQDARRALESAPAPTNAEVCRVLLPWVGTDNLGKTVVAALDAVVAQVIRSPDALDRALLARWVARRAADLTPGTVAAAARALGPHFRDQMNQDGSVPLARKLLDGVTASDDLAPTALNWVVGLAAAGGPAVARQLLTDVLDRDLYRPVDWLRAVGPHLADWAPRWEAAFRLKLVTLLTGDPAAAIATDQELEAAAQHFRPDWTSPRFVDGGSGL